MKIKNLFNGLFITFGFIAALSLLHAQEAATPVQEGTFSLTTANDQDVSGLSDFEVELRALEMMPTIPAAALPPVGDWHGFYSVQNPGWPPLPGDISGVPVWNMGNGFFALDDRTVNYNPPVKSKATIKTPGEIGRAITSSGAA